LVLAPIRPLPIDDVRPSLENALFYRPAHDDDPDIQQMARSIEESGLIKPLILTADRYIISGHRRYQAARLAGLQEIDCRIRPYRKDDDHERFMRELREANLQRVKTFDEAVREEVAAVSAEDAYAELVEYREHADRVDVKVEEIRGTTARAKITEAKLPFLDAIIRVLNDRREFWPLSVRQIHYGLLNDPPLRHASKPDSAYANDVRSYKSLDELVTRARIAKIIPMDAIGDETRPVKLWPVDPNVQAFTHEALKDLLRGYWRDLLQSQPHQLEIAAEKNTVLRILEPLAREYTIPMTSLHGQSSLPPRRGIVDRFRASGKRKLILLILTDCDCDGDAISNALSKSIRDDFDVDGYEIMPIRVALTHEQAEQHGLPRDGLVKAKKSSSNYKTFVSRHGTDAAYELEALPPAVLQDMLHTAIDSVLDRDAFDHEVEQEKEDAAFLERQRRRVLAALRAAGLEEEDHDVL